MRRSDSNIKVENNSHLTGFPTEITVTVALCGNLCCNSQHCGGHNQDIPAEIHRLDSAGLTLLSPSRNCVSFLDLHGKETAGYASSLSTSASM